MKNTILAAVLSLAVAPAMAYDFGFAQGSASAGSQSSVASGSSTFAIDNGIAVAGNLTNANNNSGASVDAEHSWHDGVTIDLSTYSNGADGTLSFVGSTGNAFGLAVADAGQSGFGTAWGQGYDVDFGGYYYWW